MLFLHRLSDWSHEINQKKTQNVKHIQHLIVETENFQRIVEKEIKMQQTADDRSIQFFLKFISYFKIT